MTHRSIFVAAFLVLAAPSLPQPLFAASRATPAVVRRTVLLAGLGVASTWHAPSWSDQTIHSVPGYRLGVLIASPGPPCTIDMGLLVDGRGFETHSAGWSYGPHPQLFVYTRRYDLLYLTAPLRFRIPVHRGPSGPYLAFGPELSLLLHEAQTSTITAAAPEKTVRRPRSPASPACVAVYTGLGVGRKLNGHDLLFELGMSVGLMPVYDQSGSADIGQARPLLVTASVGFVR